MCLEQEKVEIMQNICPSCKGDEVTIRRSEATDLAFLVVFFSTSCHVEDKCALCNRTCSRI